jgi:hypothetical protein
MSNPPHRRKRENVYLNRKAKLIGIDNANRPPQSKQVSELGCAD